MRSSTFRLELPLCMKPSNGFKGSCRRPSLPPRRHLFKSRSPDFHQGCVVTLPWFYPLKSYCYHTTCTTNLINKI